jgi:hypothetical protein
VKRPIWSTHRGRGAQRDPLGQYWRGRREWAATFGSGIRLPPEQGERDPGFTGAMNVACERRVASGLDRPVDRYCGLRHEEAAAFPCSVPGQATQLI